MNINELPDQCFFCFRRPCTITELAACKEKYHIFQTEAAATSNFAFHEGSYNACKGTHVNVQYNACQLHDITMMNVYKCGYYSRVALLIIFVIMLCVRVLFKAGYYTGYGFYSNEYGNILYM